MAIRAGRLLRVIRLLRALRALRLFLFMWRGLDHLAEIFDVRLMKKSFLAGLFVLILAPLSGYVALRFHERKAHFLRQARAFFLLEFGQRSVVELRTLRRQVLEKLRRLVAVYTAEEGA